jgi:hypothetical protein
MLFCCEATHKVRSQPMGEFQPLAWFPLYVPNVGRAADCTNLSENRKEPEARFQTLGFAGNSGGVKRAGSLNARPFSFLF